MRLEGKVAVIVGAGQSPGEGIGNGRATTLRFAQEGARILAVDRLIASAEETAAMATQGGECVPFAADVTKEETLAAAMEAARARWGRIDILHNNVGVSIGGGDKPLDELSEEAFDRVCAINLRGTIMACKHVLPIMRLQRSGAIINISSVAARENSYPLVTYKATKAAMIAFTVGCRNGAVPVCLWVLVSLQPPRVFIQKIAAVTRARSSLNAGLPVPPQIPQNRKSATFELALVAPVSSSVPQCLRKVGFETPSTRAMSTSGMPEAAIVSALRRRGAGGGPNGGGPWKRCR